MIEFRPLAEDDLAQLEEWLNRPHVRRWWRDDIDESLTEYRAAIEGREPDRSLHRGDRRGGADRRDVEEEGVPCRLMRYDR